MIFLYLVSCQQRRATLTTTRRIVRSVGWVTETGRDQARAVPETQVLLFGKPDARPHRRLGVALARGSSEAEARQRADAAAACVRVVGSP